MRLIAWWIGTDAYTLVNDPPSASKLWHWKLKLYRLKWKFLKRYFTHWAVHENLTIYLKRFGIDAEVRVWPADYPKRIEKKPHEGFNILYYRPAKYANLGGWTYLNWYYGHEIFLSVKKYFKNFQDINFIIADGTADDIDDLYAISDIYIRPNRWDGHPRMTQECEIKEIPFYWESRINEQGFLSANYIDCKNFIKTEYDKYKARLL